MAFHTWQKALERSRTRTRLSRWNKLLTGMAAIVVFCTTYALILPAITMEQEPTCGLEEHVHTSECMVLPKVLTCLYQRSAQDGGDACVVHTHNDLCYDAHGVLICALPQVELHTHDDSCYTLITPAPPHVHTAECWKETRTLICPLEESEGHTHTDECGKQEEEHLICQLPEVPAHAHSESCMDADGNVICGLEPTEGHTHGPACKEIKTTYACGLEESQPHVHTDECYEIKTELICGLEQATEEELADPPQPYRELTCGKEEIVLHTHAGDCFDENGNVVCKQREVFEHTHMAACLSTTTDVNAEKVVGCGLEEHTHDKVLCYIDLEADLETPELWESTLPELAGERWADDLLAVAESQLDYAESTVNVQVAADGTIFGYTRYGQWAGEPYGPWSGHFVSFCRHYALIPDDAFPVHEGQAPWCEKLAEENFGIYFTPDVYTPVPGDTAYFDLDLDGDYDHMAIVEDLLPATEEEEAKLLVIEGGRAGVVRRFAYRPDAPELLGYGSTALARERWEELNPQPEKPVFCGLAEHTHGPECVDEFDNLICTLPQHTHTEPCYVEPVTYYCGREEHTHAAGCYDEGEQLICDLEEHTHTAPCLVETVYICGQEEHSHEDACYDNKGALTCSLPEHTHTADCLQPIYYCGLEEHVHTPECKDAEGNLICELPEHTHAAACEAPPKTYYCGLPEHTHIPECMDAEGNLICELTVHTHDESCEVEPVRYHCGKTVHGHTVQCYDESGALICTQEEHVHTALCQLKTGFICGKEEHTHTQACQDEADPCKLEEHTHTETCIVYYTCGQDEHQHTDACHNEKGEPVCGISEHSHSSACMLTAQTIDANIENFAETQEETEGPTPSITITGYIPTEATITAIPLDMEGTLFAYDITIYDAVGNEFQPVVPVEVSFFVPGITDDSEQELDIYHQENANAEESAEETGEATLVDSHPDGEGNIVVEAPHFSPFFAKRRDATSETTHNCTLKTNPLEEPWTPCGNDTPFGGAQEFNVFLLGNLDGWNAIHGNAAIGGNITGVNGGIGYTEGSRFDYAGILTEAHDIALILGGEISTKTDEGADKPVQVANGSAIVRDSQETKIELNDSIRPDSEVHPVPETTPDPFKTYFGQAGKKDETLETDPFYVYANSLKQHNDNVYNYATGLDPQYAAEPDKAKDDGHLGKKRYVSEYSDAEQKKLKLDIAGARADDIVLHGDNRFYNVFNLTIDDISTVNSKPRIIFLDIPDDSYAMINIVGQGKTAITDFGIMLWYRDSNDEWKNQPAKQNAAADYDQSQMVLVNVDPAITSMNYTVGSSDYFYSSILAPRVDMDATGGANLHGTIVFNSMTGGQSSNAVYSPFLTGSSMTLTKETYCDHPDNTDHKTIYNSNSPEVYCQIEQAGKNDLDKAEDDPKTWATYYADLLFNVTNSSGQTGVPALKRGLPMDGDNDGKPFVISGLSPGTYQIVDEVVYQYKTDSQNNTVRYTVDEDGYRMLVTYVKTPGGAEDLNVNNWTLIYCDSNFDPILDKTTQKPIVYNKSRTATEKASMGLSTEAAANFLTFRHYWNYAEFVDGKGNKTPYITVQSGQQAQSFGLINHYDLNATESRTIVKKWMDKDGTTEVVAPENSYIEVTLRRKVVDPKTSAVLVDEAVPVKAGLQNPVTLQSGKWVYTWNDLETTYTVPETTTQYKYEYYIKETAGFPGFTPQPPVEDPNTGIITLKNKKADTGPNSLTITKGWYDNGRLLSDQEAIDLGLSSHVTLYRREGHEAKFTEKPELVYPVRVYYNGTLDDDRIGLPTTGEDAGKDKVYFTESDINVELDFYVYSPNANNGGLQDPFMKLNEVSFRDPITDVAISGSSLQVIGNSAHNGTHWYTHCKLTLPLKNAEGRLSFKFVIPELAQDNTGCSLATSAHVKSMTSQPTGMTVVPPVLTVPMSRINPKAIIWDATKDIPVPVEPDTVVPPATRRYDGWDYDKVLPTKTVDNVEVAQPVDMELRTLPSGDWIYTWDNLPTHKTGDTETRYGYYVLEDDVGPDWTPTYYYSDGRQHGQLYVPAVGDTDPGIEAQPPVNAGHITIRNRKDPSGPELPMTGGCGTIPYTLGGLLCAVAAVLLMQYNHKKRRKEDTAS